MQKEKGRAAEIAPRPQDNHTLSLCKSLLGRTQAGVCVHHLGRHIGFIIEAKCGLFDAVSIRGGALGRYNSEHAAATAILTDLGGGHA